MARHCNGPGCDTWQRLDARLPCDFLDVTMVETGTVLHFCSWDCLLKHAAGHPPLEMVELSP